MIDRIRAGALLTVLVAVVGIGLNMGFHRTYLPVRAMRDPASANEQDRSSTDCRLTPGESTWGKPVAASAAVTGDASGNSQRLTTKASRQRVKAFLAEANWPVMPRDIQGLVLKEDVPALYEVLADLASSDKWSRALFAICQLDEPQKAFETVTKHVGTVHDWRTAGVSTVHTKMNSILLLGWLGPSVAYDFLAMATTKEGSEEFLHAWRISELPERYTPEALVRLFRLAAGKGLLIFQDDQYMEPLRQQYEDFKCIAPHRGLSREEEDAREMVKGNLALRDMQREIGFERSRRLLASKGDDSDVLALIAPYHEPYDREWAAMTGVKYISERK